MKTIEVINPANLPTIQWAKLKAEFQSNALKKKENRNVGDLKNDIVAEGFTFPIFIWLEGKFVIDGAGRLLALEMLEYEGYEIPNIPFVPITANSLQQAKKLTLKASSQYGQITPDSLGEFTLDLKGIDLSFINIEGFNLEEIDWKPPVTKEIDINKLKGESKIEHKCPQCGFKFKTT